MPIPNRLTDASFHYHIYDYAGAVPFVDAAVPGGGAPTFYSMEADLNALVAEGPQVPNLGLHLGAAQTLEGRETMVLSFGNAAGAANPPTVVITGGMHAREWIGHEIAYLVAEYLIKNYTNAPNNRYQRAIRNLVDSRQIYVIPMLNPDGNVYSVTGPTPAGDPPHRQWRKNRRGLPANGAGWANLVRHPGPGGAQVPNQPFANFSVNAFGTALLGAPDYDPAHHIPPFGPAHIRVEALLGNQRGIDLNRNYATSAWGYDAQPDSPNANSNPMGLTYYGPKRNSERETRNVTQFLANLPAPVMVVSAIDYHSYAKCILYPSEAFNNGAVTPDYQALGAAMQLLITRGAAPDYYRLGSSTAMVHYDGTGTISDHIAEHYGARAVTVELDPGPGQGDAGFVLAETEIRKVFEKNIRGALVAIAAPRPAAATWQSVTRRGAKIAQSYLQFLTWNATNHGNTLPG
jgi:Zinc carboxypeptidase